MATLTRFAPSPTGLLHIGNIRAALFNFLFARKTGGRFMLRMDDTDRERSTAEFAAFIERDLRWLGLNWDKFARQSDRLDRYSEALRKLAASGLAYQCFETQAELDLKRKTQLGRGLPPVYDRAALRLTDEAMRKFQDEGRKPHWRFKLDHGGVTEWNDGIQGSKSFPSASLSDPVIMREDGVPLYTFCSVVDDADLGVTNVIRGEDHVTNTAVQLQIWQAVTDAPPPAFAHFPLLVNATGEEMSKRLGTLSISSIRDDMGIEAMAVNSLLARLGTSDPITPKTRVEDLAADFGLDRISRATPKFDMADLRRVNAGVLHATPFAAVAERLRGAGVASATEDFWVAVRPNLETLANAKAWWNVVSGIPPKSSPENRDFLKTAASLLPPAPWDEATWGAWTNAIKSATGRKGKELFMPLRLALTGCDHGPEMKALLPLIGRDRVLARLRDSE